MVDDALWLADSEKIKGWSNNEIVAKIDKGKLSRSERNAKTQYQLAKTTTNASGKKQWTGVKKLLKESQFRGKYNLYAIATCDLSFLSAGAP